MDGNVLIRTAVLASCFGWYENRIKLVQEYLKKKGFNVIVLLSDFNHQLKEKNAPYVNQQGVEYIHTKTYRGNLSMGRVYSHYLFSKSVGKK